MADITERLREHAEIHEAHIPHDDEQRLWADDLRKAADEIERLRARVAYLDQQRTGMAIGLDVRDEKIDILRARVAELESQERGGWIRTSGWSNELYSFDRSDNEDGTFALTVSERNGKRLVDIDRLTSSDLKRIIEIIEDGIMLKQETVDSTFSIDAAMAKDGAQ